MTVISSSVGDPNDSRDLAGDELRASFDFEAHRRDAIEQFRRVRDVYVRFAEVVGHVLEASLEEAGVIYHKIEARAKDFESFGRKAAKPLDDNATTPRYPDPLRQITDLAGARVIAFFPRTLDDIDRCVYEQFVVTEKTDKAELLEEEGRFGYKSIHYLVRMRPERLALPEYSRFAGLTVEIQSRTILQHAWAEMEHDIQYKSVEVIPTSIRRRFIALAGMLEIADREFQAIQDEDERIRAEARSNVERGNLEVVEITPDALKSYLDKRLGSDGRMTPFSYDFLARTLRHMGFKNFQQIDECIAEYNDDAISRILWGARQGQITRFEDMLRAGMGENFNRLHRWSDLPWWTNRNEQVLRKLREVGIPVRNYDPNPAEVISVPIVQDT